MRVNMKKFVAKFWFQLIWFPVVILGVTTNHNHDGWWAADFFCMGVVATVTVYDLKKFFFPYYK